MNRWIIWKYISRPPRSPVKYGTSNILECGINGSNEQFAVPLVYNGYSYDKGEWPWLVAIYKTKFTSLSYVCAGTLISDRHVVTGKICLFFQNAILLVL